MGKIKEFLLEQELISEVDIQDYKDDDYYQPATDRQVAGNHYASLKIQPVEFISANNLNFLEGCIVKRISRWRNKDGIQDLEKIKHEVDLLIQMYQKYEEEPPF